MAASRANKRPHPWRRRGVIVLGAVLVVVIALALLASHLFDEPLRRDLEAKLNQRLNGYSVSLGHAHAGLFGLSLTLRRRSAMPKCR